MKNISDAKMFIIRFSFVMLVTLILLVFLQSSFTPEISCSLNKKPDTAMEIIKTRELEEGIPLIIDFHRGKTHHHPLMAIWIEDMEENYIQTLYVAKSIAKGIFEHGDISTGKWLPGEVRRPAALPYWSHKRNIQEEDGYYVPTAKTPMPDAVTGATPLKNFRLVTRANIQEGKKFRVLMEINQSFDWNEYWNNTKYPEDEQYKSSCQPSVIYAVTVNPEDMEMSFHLHPTGHGHYSGKNGKLNTDLSTLTTALEIVEKAVVRIGRQK